MPTSSSSGKSASDYIKKLLQELEFGKPIEIAGGVKD